MPKVAKRAQGATLRFLGAAGTVTGSKHLITCRGGRVLLDCGLFQGLKALRRRNWRLPPVDPATLNAVVLSHAHIDHSGALPLLARHGFHGAVHCTPATAELLEILLLDAAHLQEEEASFVNRHRTSKHRPALPLYTSEDAQAALRLLQTHPYGEEFEAADHVRASFRRAGHILGSAIVLVRIAATEGSHTLAFSGDLGRWGRPILRDPEAVGEADVMLVESTYGDRLHAPEPERALAEIVNDVAERKGVLLVPAFAVDRTQELLYLLHSLEDAGTIPSLPVFIDSPMAIDVTEIYARHADEHDLDMQKLVARGTSPLAPRRLQIMRSAAESKSLNERSGPMILISASGMATGGRVLHHLLRLLPDADATVLFTGFQAAGTRGRSLQEGAKSVRIFGQDVGVRARVATLDGLSAHADQADLLRWLGGMRRPPRHTYVVHGEPHASDTLRALIEQRLGWRASVAEDGQTVPLP